MTTILRGRRDENQSHILLLLWYSETKNNPIFCTNHNLIAVNREFCFRLACLVEFDKSWGKSNSFWFCIYIFREMMEFGRTIIVFFCQRQFRFILEFFFLFNLLPRRFIIRFISCVTSDKNDEVKKWNKWPSSLNL